MAYEIMSGSQAAATAVQRANVDLVAAYPITPQTAIVETLANYEAKGELGADFVSVESEYAALACCYGAAAAGARVFTATASHGLAYMHEVIHWCGGARVPLVMVNVNRTIGAPWSLDPDQGDSLSQRDTGWMQLYCSGAQEVFDSVLQAYVLSENLLLPCLVVFDGFYISHTYEAIDVPELEKTVEFVGKKAFKPQVVPETAVNLHGLTTGDNQTLLVRKRHETMLKAFDLFKDINDRFYSFFGRSYKVVDATIPGGAKTVFMAAGSTVETIKWALPELAGCGLIQLRMFRPYPEEELISIVKMHEIEKVIVVDRNCSVGSGGIFAQELKAALYKMKNPPVVEDLILAGGIDLTIEMLKNARDASLKNKSDHFSWGVDLR